ncbi:hypothetical protein HKD42_12545 [Altererythrobacter sp. RZ02]|uniref:Uncharacterized protein n=1 Tax=Pontixanthobacter rizhaonensis TaxID=2730337 RepID=A0A848QJR7_9SPHN|nr:hypothetical protein [Pontixanthobacter rizhaonensis]NMW32892.1 hypothetical protein [Pontixanthobacter rizhaonensis]
MTGYLPVRAFDSDDWRAAKDDGSQTRVEMIEHLTRSGTLDELAKQQVFDLLGECRDTAYFNEWDCVYRLGDQRGFFSLDSEWLVIDFSQDGIVQRYEVVSD